MANKTVIRSVKGTRDYYPEDMAVRTWLYGKMREVSESFGYSEYEGPLLESFNLYSAKSSEEIVEKQSYVFTDRGGDKITLRPELTPTLARMVAQKQAQLTFPLRWWSFGPFWRYERPQKGRTREFFQWNIDLIGDPSPEADAELLGIAAIFLKTVGFKPNEVQILVNDRHLMDEEMRKLGISETDRGAVFQLVDRKDKMKPESWLENAKDLGLNKEQISRIEKLITDKELWKKSETLPRIFDLVEEYGIGEYIQFAPHIIRGLVYYTGTVFEAWDTAGEHRALFGGGRYDNLVGDVGGEAIGGVGFALGDLVISLYLEELGRLPEFSKTPASVFITTFDPEHYKVSLQIAKELRYENIKSATYPNYDKLGKQLKYADRIKAKIAIVIGPDELKNNSVNIKIMESGEQITVPRNQAISKIKKLLVAK